MLMFSSRNYRAYLLSVKSFISESGVWSTRTAGEPGMPKSLLLKSCHPFSESPDTSSVSYKLSECLEIETLCRKKEFKDRPCTSNRDLSWPWSMLQWIVQHYHAHNWVATTLEILFLLYIPEYGFGESINHDDAMQIELLSGLSVEIWNILTTVGHRRSNLINENFWSTPDAYRGF